MRLRCVINGGVKLANNLKTKNCVVYKHTSPNGKVYIGITCGNPLNRWRGGIGYIKNTHFYRAIIKYGWDNFAHEILYDGLSRDDACAIERKLIATYKSNDKRYGYNITDGGDYFNHSLESREKMSLNRMGKGTGAKSEETKARMRENHGGGAKPSAVRCIDTNNSFNSIKEAARWANATPRSISCCCRHIPHYNTAAGYHWEFVGEQLRNEG